MSRRQTPTTSPLLRALGIVLRETRDENEVGLNEMSRALDGTPGGDQAALSLLERGLMGWPEHIDLIVERYALETDTDPLVLWTVALARAGYVREQVTAVQDDARASVRHARAARDAAKASQAARRAR